jgi:pyruvate-formate lyase-activating enzyme
MSAGPKWLCDLIDAAARAGAPVRSASALGGVLKLVLDPATPASSPLEVEIKLVEPGRRYFVRTRRYGLSYRGPSQLPVAEVMQMKKLASALGAIEDGLPDVLEARVGVDAAGGQAGFPFCTVERFVGPSGEPAFSELLVRLTSRCNQRCPFCSAPPPHAEPDLGAVVAWLETALAGAPRPIVTLTGGEPTLWPGLAELVREFLSRPEILQVKVQTNAVAFDDPRALDGWPASDRLMFFVSLHGANDNVYDLCTGTTGQLARAVAGIRNLLKTDGPVLLNLVVNRHNVDHLEEWVHAVADLFRGPRMPRLHFSTATCPDHRVTAPDCLVRYTDLAPKLQAAASLAVDLGLDCESLLSSSHASIPACLLDPAHRVRPGAAEGRDQILPVHSEAEVGVEGAGKPWVKARCCERCSQTRWCLGLPRAYVQRFGLGELLPV